MKKTINLNGASSSARKDGTIFNRSFNANAIEEAKANDELSDRSADGALAAAAKGISPSKNKRNSMKDKRPVKKATKKPVLRIRQGFGEDDEERVGGARLGGGRSSFKLGLREDINNLGATFGLMKQNSLEYNFDLAEYRNTTSTSFLANIARTLSDKTGEDYDMDKLADDTTCFSANAVIYNDVPNPTKTKCTLVIVQGYVFIRFRSNENLVLTNFHISDIKLLCIALKVPTAAAFELQPEIQ